MEQNPQQLEAVTQEKTNIMIEIRIARKSEIEWINNKYDEVAFVHSTFDKELIAIAEVNDEKIGVGRLVTIDENNLELGGMYVFEDFRGQGVAKKIVEFLLKFSKSTQKIYCIPFQHLTSFYNALGFIQCIDLDQVPKEILTKYLWCKDKYSTPTALLILKQKGD